MSSVQLRSDQIKGLNLDKIENGDKILLSDGSVPLENHLDANDFIIRNAQDPILPGDVATKRFVESVATGLQIKQPVEVATLGNINLFGLQIIDEVELTEGMRVLVKNQDDPVLNGIFIASPLSWYRAEDFDANSEIVSGSYIFVSKGTINEARSFVLSSQESIVLGVSQLNFVQFSASVTTQAGTGLTKVGNKLNLVVVDHTRLEIYDDGLDLVMTTVTPGGYNFATFDAYGRATGGFLRELVSNSTCLTITNGTGEDGDPTIELNENLDTIAALTTIGFINRTDSTHYYTRSLQSNNSILTITNGNGAVGDPTFDLALTSGWVIMGDSNNKAVKYRKVTRETITSADNLNYLLSYAIVPGTEHVFLNGLLQAFGLNNDYTITENYIVFTSSNMSTDIVVISYLASN